MSTDRDSSGPLGELIKVRIRDHWPREATDFTPWLAKPSNIEKLGFAVGLSLATEGIELKVGHFSADIVCTDVAAGGRGVIENQLEPTNHRHLGQLLTYGNRSRGSVGDAHQVTGPSTSGAA